MAAGVLAEPELRINYIPNILHETELVAFITVSLLTGSNLHGANLNVEWVFEEFHHARKRHLQPAMKKRAIREFSRGNGTECCLYEGVRQQQMSNPTDYIRKSRIVATFISRKPIYGRADCS